jgi:hypothetical protein
VRRALFVALASLILALACSTPTYHFVKPVAHCTNQRLDADLGETDVDCGGSDCNGCGLGKACTQPDDCSAGQCLSGFCLMQGCDNAVRDGAETGVDCGGGCKGCPDGDPCGTGSDCENHVCNPDGHCASPTCDDGVLNGDETARDCGGTMCDGCAAGATCTEPTDCLSGICDSTCTLVCARGTEDCDGDQGNGCETNLFTSGQSCGACGHKCVLANAHASCTGGECQIEDCVAPFEGCNTDESDGCETNLSADAMNCGGCGLECPAINGDASCVSGTCRVKCEDNFGDCDDDASNGCETSLNDVNNCGKCGTVCPDVDGQQAFCRNGECGATACKANLGDCDGDSTCETDLSADPNNCGRCGALCSVVHGTAGCDAGHCVVAACDKGFDNCNKGADDGGYSDGCEANLNENPDDCGACDNRCQTKNGNGTCDKGSCAIVSCNSGYKDCDMKASNGCEVNTATDPGNCGGCGNACDAPNAVSGCVDSTCTVASCEGQFRHCVDGADGCETDTSSSIQHCGSCTGTCSKAGATSASCTKGACDAPACDSSHLNCDGNNANGCETDLTLATNCGACGNACGASEKCISVGGTYGCQATVTYQNDVEGSSSGTTLNLAHALKAASHRLVLAAIVMESTQNAGVNGARPTAVTYGSVPMTAGPFQSSDAGSAAYDNPYLYYYYLTDTGTNRLPSSGQTLTVTGTSGKVTQVSANVVEFAGVNQTAPLIAGTGKTLINSGGSCAATSAVTTTLGGSALYVLSAAHYSGTASVTGSQLLNPPAWDSGQLPNQVRIYATFGGTDTTTLAPGTYTVGFTYQWCNPAVNLPVGVVAYRQQ